MAAYYEWSLHCPTVDYRLPVRWHFIYNVFSDYLRLDIRLFVLLCNQKVVHVVYIMIPIRWWEGKMDYNTHKIL